MKFESLQAAEAALAHYTPAVKDLLGKNVTMERMWPLLEAAGNPHKKLRVIHVAGTSGKTSTCYYLAALLELAGKKTGLTVSPHVDSVKERLQINAKPVRDKSFCELLAEFLTVVKDVQPEPTYFELIIAFALWTFGKEAVDYVILETGMGGLHDATNVVSRADKFCVLTDIGFDHMQVLGNTLPEIAAQKAGIMHAHNQAVTFEQSDEIMKVFKDYAAKAGAELYVTTEAKEAKKNPINLGELPLFQQRNWLLAYRTYQLLSERDGLPNLTKEQLKSTLRVRVPGRMDTRQVNDKTLIMDGAHNEQKMRSFVESFTSRYPNTKATILIAMKTGKEFSEVINLLLPIADSFIFTVFNVVQDLPSTSISPEILAKYCDTLGFKKYTVVKDNQAAYEKLIEEGTDINIITGSFYLLSQLRSLEHLAP